MNTMLHATCPELACRHTQPSNPTMTIQPRHAQRPVTAIGFTVLIERIAQAIGRATARTITAAIGPAPIGRLAVSAPRVRS